MKSEMAGDYSYQMHDVTFGYNYQKNDSTFFNAKLKYALTDHPHNDFKSNLKENSIEIGQILDGVSQKINTPTMDLYYEHGLKNQQKNLRQHCRKLYQSRNRSQLYRIQ